MRTAWVRGVGVVLCGLAVVACGLFGASGTTVPLAASPYSPAAQGEVKTSRTNDLPEYRAGTWGPLEADRLIEADGRRWRTL